MADTIALEIVTPDGLKLKEAVNELTAPSVEGEFGVLPQHRPMLAALATGIVTYIQNGKSESVAVGPGFVEVAADKALLLTERFIKKTRRRGRTRLDLKSGRSARTLSRAIRQRRVRGASRERSLGRGPARAARRSTAAAHSQLRGPAATKTTRRPRPKAKPRHRRRRRRLRQA